MMTIIKLINISTSHSWIFCACDKSPWTLLLANFQYSAEFLSFLKVQWGRFKKGLVQKRLRCSLIFHLLPCLESHRDGPRSISRFYGHGKEWAFPHVCTRSYLRSLQESKHTTKQTKWTEIQQKVPSDPRPLVWKDFSK